MQEVMIGFQFTALIPILVILYYKPALNGFFKLLLATILLSIVFDIFGTLLYSYDIHNTYLYFLYTTFNITLIVFMWQKIPFYEKSSKKFIKTIGSIFFAIIILIAIYFNFTEDAFYLVSSFSVSLSLILALHYYYQKLALSSYTSPLDDPYFFAASGCILFSLSTIIILAALVKFKDESFVSYAWVLRQFFYFIYNVILGYAFYTLHKSQVLRQ